MVVELDDNNEKKIEKKIKKVIKKIEPDTTLKAI